MTKKVREATRATLTKLKPSVRTISLRLPESMLEALKSERISREFQNKPGPKKMRAARAA